MFANVGYSQAQNGVSPFTPAWTPSAGTLPRAKTRLLIATVWNLSAFVAPTAAGWSTAVNLSFLKQMTILYKVAAGADAAPAVTATAGNQMFVALMEFSGNEQGNPLNQSGVSSTGAGGASPLVATAAGADATAGELIVYLSGAVHTVAATETLSNTLNNGASANDVINNLTDGTTGTHWAQGWGITTDNPAADTDTFTFPAPTNVDSAGVVFASFRNADAIFSPRRTPLGA